jgi:large subunit ribosomal protein L16
MLQPKKRKYRKDFRGTRSGIATRGNQVSFGEYGIKALSAGWLTSRQLEAARKKISATTKRSGKMWIRIFPDKPITKKGPGAKMGSGKGDIDSYVCVIKPGRVLFEISGVPEAVASEALTKAMHKLPMKTVIVAKQGL